VILREPTFSVDTDPGIFRVATVMAYGWAAMLVVIRIPVGFETDFASIPRPLRILFQVNGKHRLSALLHDWLYRCGGHLDVDQAFHEEAAIALVGKKHIIYTRKDADLLFYTDMRAAGVGRLKAWSMYPGVRAFGWMFWNKCKQGEAHGHE